MSTALDLDLAALVGELEDVPCESLTHATHPEHGGAATHYARVHCPECSYSDLKAYCGPFVEFIKNDGPIRCFCERLLPASRIFTILGPVNGRAS